MQRNCITPSEHYWGNFRVLTRIVGDIHGDTHTYHSIVRGRPASIQIGDYGLGFSDSVDKTESHWQTVNPQHRFIRGNHDSPVVCGGMPNYVGDYALEGTILYIGGAWSIDYYHRQEGHSWWSDEELSQDQWKKVLQLHREHKPKVVISHDAPHGVPKSMGLLNSTFGGETITRTSYRMAQMMLEHQPEWWFFGHWHQTKHQKIKGTNFQCLGVGDYVDFDLETLEF